MKKPFVLVSGFSSGTVGDMLQIEGRIRPNLLFCNGAWDIPVSMCPVSLSGFHLALMNLFLDN